MSRSSRCSRGSTSVIATPSRPARPVRPIRWTYVSGRRRDVVVDDVADVLDVEAARGDVGRDEHVEGAVAEAGHDPVALLLRQAAVERGGVPAAARQRLGEVVHLAPGPGEHERRGAVLEVQDPAERGRACRRGARRRRPGGPGPARRRRRASAWTWTRAGWRRCALREARDLARDRRREQRGLADLAERAEDPLEVVGEAHVEHLVGLVEDDRVDVLEAERAAVEVVDRAARGRDHDVDAAREPVELGRDRLAAVDRHDADAELACRTCGSPRRPASRARGSGRARAPSAGRPCRRRRRRGASTGPAGRPALVEPDGEALEDRQREGGGLAGAGGASARRSRPREQRRDRGELDRRGLLVAEVGERPQQALVEAERREPGRRASSAGVGSAASPSRSRRERNRSRR